MVAQNPFMKLWEPAQSIGYKDLLLTNVFGGGLLPVRRLGIRRSPVMRNSRGSESLNRAIFAGQAFVSRNGDAGRADGCGRCEKIKKPKNVCNKRLPTF